MECLALIYLTIGKSPSIAIAMNNVNEIKGRVPSRSQALVPPPILSLAHLLQQLESNPLEASAEQYRQVAARLKQELETTPVDVHLDAVLRSYPAAADIYENLRYDVAGLCRAPLEQAVRGELEAKKAIEAAAKRPTDAGA